MKSLVIIIYLSEFTKVVHIESVCSGKFLKYMTIGAKINMDPNEVNGGVVGQIRKNRFNWKSSGQYGNRLWHCELILGHMLLKVKENTD